MQPYSVKIDLVGYSSRTFLAGWSMPKRTLAKLNRAVVSDTIQGISSVSGDIAGDDNNEPGDNKVYLAAMVLVNASTERQAEGIATARPIVDAVLAALPQRGGFDLEGEADCLECSIADDEAIEALRCISKRARTARKPSSRLQQRQNILFKTASATSG